MSEFILPNLKSESSGSIKSQVKLHFTLVRVLPSTVIEATSGGSISFNE
ncbi:MAG: hypothetical protein LBQ59_00695 [Candidatus Peribacteria bacterium]|nr:hypothetical protein [Candidatus Peribacteria bacterium]